MKLRHKQLNRYRALPLLLFASLTYSQAAQTNSPYLIHSNNLILFSEPSNLNYSSYPILKETIKKYIGTSQEPTLELTNEFSQHGALLASHSVEKQFDEQQTQTLTETRRLRNGNWQRKIQVIVNQAVLSTFTVIFQRDPVGHITTEELQNAAGAMLMRIHYGYDPDDRVINGKSVTYGENESDYMNSRTFFNYNNNKQITKLYSESSPAAGYRNKREIELVYNKKQQPIAEKITSVTEIKGETKPQLANMTCKFTKFDKHHNWLQKSCSGDIRVSRELNYYE